jgi:WD40 repeat protein
LLGIDQAQTPPTYCVIKQFCTDAIHRVSSPSPSQKFQLPHVPDQPPQLVKWLDLFQQDGLLYLVQEYVPGEHLATALAEKGSFTTAEVVQVLERLLPALQWLHEVGVIHGDIKPENIICRVSGDLAPNPGNLTDLVLVDLGPTVFTTMAGMQSAITNGSPAYAAPEQLKGSALFASDLYSLGVTAIHLLTGIHPFSLFDFVGYQWAWRNYWSPDAVNSQERLYHQQLADFLDRLIEPDLQQRLSSVAAAITEIQKLQLLNRRVTISRPMPASKPSHSPTWECVATLVGHHGLFAGVNAIAFSPDGTLLASASDDKTIRLWDIQTGKEVLTLCGHNEFVKSVAFHPQTPTILVSGSRVCRVPAYENCGIQLWNLQTGQAIQTLTDHLHTVNAVLFSPDGTLLASGSADKTVKLWHAETGKLITSLKGHTLAVNALAFSPQSSWGDATRALSGTSRPILASASTDTTVRLWDLETLQPIRTLTGHTAGVRAVTFSAMGNWLATAGEDRIIRLWDTTSWQCVRTLSGHPWVVSALAFSADGKTLMSGSWDKTIKFWQVSTGTEMGSLSGHTDAVTCVAIAPNQHLLASGSSDQTIRLWRVVEGLPR